MKTKLFLNLTFIILSIYSGFCQAQEQSTNSITLNLELHGVKFEYGSVILSESMIPTPNGWISSLSTLPSCKIISGSGITGGDIKDLYNGDVIRIDAYSIIETPETENALNISLKQLETLKVAIIDLGGSLNFVIRSGTRDEQAMDLINGVRNLNGHLDDAKFPFLPKSTYTFDASVGFKGNYKVNCRTLSHLNLSHVIGMLVSNQSLYYSVK